MHDSTAKAPTHLWIVGILAVLWNAIGAFDFSATQLRYAPYMSEFSQAQLDYFYAFPGWAVACWAFAVWGSLLASIGLLLRKQWAAWLFGAVLFAMALTALYNFVLSDGLAIMGQGAVLFTLVIWAVAIFLAIYSHRMLKAGVLR